jgi:hypothetical protein
MRAFRAEELVAKLFQALGYDVAREADLGTTRIDIVAKKEGRKVLVEVIAMPDSGALLHKLRADAARLQSLVSIGDHGEPIIAVVGHLSPAAKEWSQAEFGQSVWDLDTLLTKAVRFPQLHKEFEDFAVGMPPRPTRPQDLPSDLSTTLVQELEAHIGENTLTPSDYEILCRRIFIYVFDPHLYGFKSQAKSADGANRYDFICRIKSGHPFWDDLRAEFRTKALLFECKNYNEKITADQVYSTERYLFAGALRTVCFLISRLGPDEGCIRAAQGAMRESGKPILLLSNRDLIDLIKLKSEEGGPEDFLDEKIWKFIVSLPR